MSQAGGPTITVVIPTRDRHRLVPRAVESALAQSVTDLEVVVVDDGSQEPVQLAAHPRVRTVRLPVNRGNAAARNAGLAEARGRWITCLDDDDLLLPHHAEVSLAAAERSTLAPPVGVVSVVEEVLPDGTVVSRRTPPTRERGRHWSLEPLEPGRSYAGKQSLVVETEVLRSIGGWDEAFRSRVVTEMFLRLNPVCSIEGIDVVTYRLHRHAGDRVSRDPDLRQASFRQLVDKHRTLFEARPVPYADLLVDHGLMSLRIGQWAPGLGTLVRAARRSPATVAARRGEISHTAAVVLRSLAKRDEQPPV